MPDEKHNKRWHDNRGELSEVIALLELIPLEALPYIVEGISQRAEQQYQLSSALQTLKTVGQDKVLALYKSKNRRRSYDRDPDLHKIVNYFFVLSEEKQEKLANELLRFSEYLVDYLATCEAFDLKPKPEELDEIKRRFIQQGPQPVQEFINGIHGEYHRLMTMEDGVETLPTPAVPKSQTVIEHESGMRIRPGDST